MLLFLENRLNKSFLVLNPRFLAPTASQHFWVLKAPTLAALSLCWDSWKSLVVRNKSEVCWRWNLFSPLTRQPQFSKSALERIPHILRVVTSLSLAGSGLAAWHWTPNELKTWKHFNLFPQHCLSSLFLTLKDLCFVIYLHKFSDETQMRRRPPLAREKTD